MTDKWIIKIMISGSPDQCVFDKKGVHIWNSKEAAVRWMNQNKDEMIEGQFYIPTQVYVKENQ